MTDWELTNIDQDAQEFLNLPEWEGVDGKLYITKTKRDEDQALTKTISIDGGGAELLNIPVSVPPETQPTERVLNMNDVDFASTFEHGVELFKTYIHFGADYQHEILVLAAMSTYFRPLFWAYPYIDFKAPIFNCGKTTAMMCLVWSSAYGATGVDPTGPTIYRYIEQAHAVLGFDEIDNKFQNPEAKSSILGILNASYRRGLPARRVNMEQGGIVENFDAFGLKSFTHTETIPESLTSRSIVFHMVRSPSNLPELKDSSTFEKFRDRMYWLKIHRKEQAEEAYEFVEHNCGLKNRGKQKFLPLLTMAYLVGEDVYQRTKDFAVQYMAGGVSQERDEWQIALIEACIKVLREETLGDVRRKEVKLRDIRDAFNEIAEKREILGKRKDGSQKQAYSKTIKRMLEQYGIYPTATRSQGYVHIMLDADKIAPWASIYDIPPKTASLDSLDSLNGEAGGSKSEASEPSEGNRGNKQEGIDKLVEDIEDPHITRLRDFCSLMQDDTDLVSVGDMQKLWGEKYSNKLDKLVTDGYIEQPKPGWWTLSDKGRAKLRELKGGA